MIIKLAALSDAINGLRRFGNLHKDKIGKELLPLAKNINDVQKYSIRAMKQTGAARQSSLFAKDEAINKLKQSMHPEEIKGTVFAGHLMNQGQIKSMKDLDAFSSKWKKS